MLERHAPALSVLLIGAAFIPGCKQGGNTDGSLFSMIPAKATAALIVRDEAVKEVIGTLLESKEMQTELSTYLVKRLGSDLTKVTSIGVFASAIFPRPRIGVLIQASMPLSAKGDKVAEHRGVPIVRLAGLNFAAASIANTLVLGTLEAVKAVIDVAKGEAKPVGRDAPLADVKRIDKSGYYVIGGARQELIPPLMRAPVERFGIKSVRVSIDSRFDIEVVVQGDKDKLAKAKKMIDEGLAQQKRRLEQQKKIAKSGSNVFLGAMAIYSYHSFSKVIKDAHLVLSGDRLSVRYGAHVKGAVPLAMVGILAAIAVPAFIKYIRKSKTIEATESLDKIAAGAKAYFQADHYDTSGNLLPKTFPPSVDWTPAGSCCQQGGKCKPDPKTWTTTSWRALTFSLGDPHYYRYRFTSAGQGKGASFVAEAIGDLDCDGVYSTYKILGNVDSDSRVRVRGPIIHNEIE